MKICYLLTSNSEHGKNVNVMFIVQTTLSKGDVIAFKDKLRRKMQGRICKMAENQP